MYTFNSRVRYTEVNHRREMLDPSAIINYFQDCSTFQSEDLNLGLSYLTQKNRIWLLSGWQLKILKPARLGDLITVGTWPYAFKGFYGYRNFILQDNQSEVFAIADSIWVYLDSERGCPVKVPEDNAGYVLEPPYPMEHADRKISIPEGLTPYPSFPVRKSNIDSYNHVNNGQYIKMAEEFLPDDFIVTGMRVEYRKQALLGDIIVPEVLIRDYSCFVVHNSLDGKPYAVIEFTASSNVSH